MFVSISVPQQNNIKIINIDITYVTPTRCLVETTGINPKVNKTTTWDNAKEYLINVTNKVNGTISLEATDSKGKDIDISELSDENDVNVDVNL